MTLSKTIFKLFFVSLFLLASMAEAQGTQAFNGKNLEGWDTVIQGQDLNSDPKNYIQVQDGMIHMYKDTDESEKVPFGYILTQDSTYSHFNLKLEYRWLDKKFAPRKNKIKDAGILFHVNNEKKVWPSSVECQIQEGDTGDLIFLTTGGLTYTAPQGHKAPQGQGSPYHLPEYGGIPKHVSTGYYGRMPEYDTPSGWNTVELTVHGSQYAAYEVNGKQIARSGDFTLLDGTPLEAGSIALQLEGAEIQYRNLTIERLDPPLQADKTWLAFSKVMQIPNMTQVVEISNPSKDKLPLSMNWVGKNKDAFRVVSEVPAFIPAHSSQKITIEFNPTTSETRQSAGLELGGDKRGVYIGLQGLVLKQFEGGNEPPLHLILETLGVPLNVGGTALHLSTQNKTIGQSVAVNKFVPIPGKAIKIIPLARFSPKGAPPFGLVQDGVKIPLGTLEDVSESIPDMHQRLFPLISDGISEMEYETDQPFDFYYEGHKYLSSTNSKHPSKATIKYTARVYPVATYLGAKVSNTYLIGFEEASNGDYQDAVFLIQNVKVE